MCMQFDRFYFGFCWTHWFCFCRLNTLAEKALFHPHELIIVYLQPETERMHSNGNEGAKKRNRENHVVVRNDSVSRVTLDFGRRRRKKIKRIWHQSFFGCFPRPSHSIFSVIYYKLIFTVEYDLIQWLLKYCHHHHLWLCLCILRNLSFNFFSLFVSNRLWVVKNLLDKLYIYDGRCDG